LFDQLISLPKRSHFIKAVVIGSCFFAAWYSKDTPTETQTARKILLTALIASALVLATTKTLSHSVLAPRPYILSQKVYHLEGDGLVEYKRIEFRVPLDDSGQQRYRALLNGDIKASDFGSFPSDHAGFFITISLGIWLASRGIGLIALAWTLFCILASKVITGMHTPIDTAAGAAIAIAGLALCRFLIHTRLGRILDRAALWTMKHGAFSSALLFAVMFEVSSTLETVQTVFIPALRLLIAVGRRTLGSG
jgi:membrane-associated phospholipid phosphatase